MQTHLQFYAGSRHLYFGALVVVDEHAKPGADTVKVKFECDKRGYTTWDAKIALLKPVPKEGQTNVTLH